MNSAMSMQYRRGVNEGMGEKWMRRRAACGAAWLAAALLCVVGGQSALLAALPGASGRVACRFDSATPAFSNVEALRDRMADSASENRADGSVTAWAQVGGVQAACEGTGGSIAVDSLWIDGASLAIWDWRALRGALPSFDIARICALDAGTALRLFGSTDILGQQVMVNEIPLTVACVFELPQGWAALGADPGSGLALCPASALEDPPDIQMLDFSVIPHDGKSAAEWVETWLSAGGLPEPAYTEERGEQLRLLTLAAQVPSLALALLTACPLLAAALALGKAAVSGSLTQLTDRTSPAARGWRTLGAGLGGSALLLAAAYWAVSLARIVADVPPSYIPTRWSDLSFWSTLATQTAQLHAQRAMTGALRPGLVRDHWIALSTALSLSAAPLLWLAWRALRQAAGTGARVWSLLWPALLACAAVPLALLLMRQLGWPSAAPAGLALSAALFSALPPLLRAYPPAALLRIYLTGDPQS